jgi:ubiquitin C-terminal hydrolase
MDMSKYADKGLSGLANLGNTCFINSTIQCLSNTYEFNEFLDSYDDEKLNDKPETLLLLEWNKLRELMWSKNCKISPGGFLSNVQKVANIKDRQIFTGFAQNDLPEFMYFLFDCFDVALRKEVNMEIEGTPKNKMDELAIKSYKMIRDTFKNNYSEVIKQFYGIEISIIADKDTNKILSETPTTNFLLSLPIPSKRNPSLIDCVDLYTENELLEGENKWFDEDADTYREVNKTIRFFSLPDTLIIDLKRFGSNLRKNNTLVSYPLNDLDMSPYVVGYKRASYKYDLYAVANHSGGVMGGHYTAYVKNPNGKWYHYNDTSVTEIDEKQIVSQKGYVLFYRKKK